MRGRVSRAAAVVIYGPPTASYHSDVNELLISASCLALIVIPYQLGMRDRLSRSGITCQDNDLSLVTDLVMDVTLACRVLLLGMCCSAKVAGTPCVGRVRFYARVVALSGIISTLVGLAGVAVVRGACALFELHMCVLAGLIVLAPGVYFFHDSSHGVRRVQARGLSLDEAEVKACQIIGGFSKAPSHKGLAAASQLGAAGGQCPICLGAFEPLDTVTTTPCNHSLHQHCLQKWLMHQVVQDRVPSCAVCRHSLETRCDSWAVRR